jgi:F-type H+-transporting ATPase subunit b
VKLLFLLAEGGEEHAATFLGLPMWLWQIANLTLFCGLLVYFLARPLAQAFRKRQEEVEERRRKAEQLRADAALLAADIHERLSKLDRELAQVRARGIAEGESERAALLDRAEREGERVRREAAEEIERRLASAKDDLKKTASDLVASAARELVAREITDDDRRRLLEQSVARLEAGR